MISFEFYNSIRILKNIKYKTVRSNNLSSFLNIEYRNNNKDHLYLFNETDNKNRLIDSIIEKMAKQDYSTRIPVGTKEHMYFMREYGNELATDRENNLIVPVEIYTKRKK